MPEPGATSTPSRPRPLYRLDDLTIDVGTAQVLRNDQPIALPRLSFDLLLALVKAAPNLVTVDELMTLVWPGVVVNAETVSQRIKLLRVALDDDPKQPRYIGVSRGRGYRILAPVTLLEAPEASPAAVPREPPSAPPPKRSRWLWGGIAALALAGIAAVFLLRDPPQTPSEAVSLPERSVAVLPFDSPGGSPEDAALAFGVAETLLHRLSSSKDLTVIARQSSFSFAPRGADVRDIGRKLNARFLVEGSLQSTATRLRITAQLIDATTGGHVWSLQFDRPRADIFVIQDEIAAKVTEAMRITLAGSALSPESGTQDFDAYLAHAQGRARLATSRVADARLAITDFERAIQIDPKFTRAYASLAQARLIVADGEMSRERGRNIDKVTADNRQLLERALGIDERDADVHLQLADMYWEEPRAEKELGRALELNPNSAQGYQYLALLRFHRDRRVDEAMAAIDKARLLSPLEVAYDNDKAQFALWGRSDPHMAEQLSLSVLNRDPSSTAALWRLGETYWCCLGEFARGVKYLEQALQLDPDFEFGRRILIRAYLDLDDPREAEAVSAGAPHAVEVRLVPLQTYAHDWAAAATRIHEEHRLGTSLGIEASLRVFAVRMHAHTSKDYGPALKYLAAMSQVQWDANDQPRVASTWGPDYAVGLADILFQKGERERARRLLEATLAQIGVEEHATGRGEFWYLRQLSVAYALLERDEDALAALEKCVTQNHTMALRLFLAYDPAYARLRSQPKFRLIVEQMERHGLAQRKLLDELRASKRVPHRSRG